MFRHVTRYLILGVVGGVATFAIFASAFPSSDDYWVAQILPGFVAGLLLAWALRNVRLRRARGLAFVLCVTACLLLGGGMVGLVGGHGLEMAMLGFLLAAAALFPLVLGTLLAALSDLDQLPAVRKAIPILLVSNIFLLWSVPSMITGYNVLISRSLGRDGWDLAQLLTALALPLLIWATVLLKRRQPAPSAS